MQAAIEGADSRPPAAFAEGAFSRVEVDLPGRMMLANFEEHECHVAAMSPGDVVIRADARPQRGERVVAYLEHVGRIEGRVQEVLPDAFVVRLNATARKRDKLAAQLTWIANKHELGLPEDRRHERVVPRNSRSEIALDDGRRYPCRIIDLSLSGAAVDIDVRPALGSRITLGSMRGRVVRHFAEGIAIEFAAIQPQEALRAYL